MVLSNQVASPKRKKNGASIEVDNKDYKENPVQVFSPYLI